MDDLVLPPSLEDDGCRQQEEVAERCSTDLTPAATEKEKAVRSSPVVPVKSFRQQEEVLNRAVESALKIHADMLAAYKKNAYCRGAKDENEKKAIVARAIAEKQVSERYEELVAAALALIPWTDKEDMPKCIAKGTEYDVIESKGWKVKHSRGEEAKLTDLLEKARSTGNCGRARDALAAVLAVLSSRADVCWLEDRDLENPVHGWFAEAMVDPHSTLRISFLPKIPRSLPASFLLTRLMPLQEALEHMDSDGPFVEQPRVMCQSPGRQFGFQDIIPGVNEEDDPVAARVNVKLVKPEPTLRSLLASKTPVLLLDSYTALAPREVSRQYGLTGVIKEEMEMLLREAKAQGRAVVMHIAGEDRSHLLAEKIYMRPQNAAYGLRCGYLRWRPSATAPWAREKDVDDRLTIGLQLP